MIGIQLNAARSGVGKFSLGADKYLVEAFGNAYVVCRRDRPPLIFWQLADVVLWVKSERPSAVSRLPINGIFLRPKLVRS
jgi:hypothetical protein